MIIQIFTFEESCLRVCQSCYDKNKEKILSWTKGNYAQCIDCCTQEWVVHCKVDVNNASFLYANYYWKPNTNLVYMYTYSI